MFFRIVNYELKKILFSRKFKFAILALILLSLFYSVQEKLEFPKYEELNVQAKIQYENRIENINDFLQNPSEAYNGYYKRYPDQLESDIKLQRKKLEYYTSHTLPNYKKNFIQGFVKNFNNLQIYIIIIGLFCSSIISDESAKNTLSFQFTSKTKRGTLYNAKYSALIISIAVLIIINVFFSFITNGLILGFSDINGSIQQIRGYEVSIVNMSILEFLLKIIVLLFISCASFACIYILMSSLFKNFLVPYILCILIITSSNVFLFEFDWKYFLLSIYEMFNWAFNPNFNLPVNLTLISMLLQSILLYIIGHFRYKRMEIN